MLLHLAREKERSHQVHEMVVSSAVGNHFQRDCNVHVTTRKGNGNGKKDKSSKSWPKECWQRKEQSKETENHKENPNLPRVPKVRTGGKKIEHLFIWS